MFFTTLFLVRILCWGLMTPRLKSLTPEWPRLTRPRPPSCFVMRRILIPDLKHGIKHLRHDVNCENAFYRHPLESWGQIRTLANILGYHWPVSRLQTGPGDTTWPVHQHQSGRVPGLSSQTVRATYFVQTERGSGDPAWGGKSGSWKLRRAIKLVTQRAMGPELMCRVWRVGKFRNSLLALMLDPKHRVLEPQSCGPVEAARDRTRLQRALTFKTLACGSKDISQKQQLQSSKVRESTWEFCWSQVIFHHYQRMVSNRYKCGCYATWCWHGIERICVASTCWIVLGTDLDGRRNKGPGLA